VITYLHGIFYKTFLINMNYHVRFEVLTAASMQMAVLCVVAPCSLVEVYRRFRTSVASTSETSVNLYQTTRCNNPEGSHLHELSSFIFRYNIATVLQEELWTKEPVSWKCSPVELLIPISE
jgi:hypothetical protein